MVPRHIFSLLLLFSCSAFASDELSELSKKQTHYFLQPGDVLDVSVWDEPTLQKEVLILPDGTLSFPLVGTVSTQGLSVGALVELLEDRLVHYVPNASVTVAIKQLQGARIYVIGKVNRPGEILLDRPLSVLQALSIAGGLTAFADDEEVHVVRTTGSEQTSITVPYGDLVVGESLKSNLALRAGDVVVVN